MIQVTVVYTQTVLRDFFRFGRFGRAAKYMPYVGAGWLAVFLLSSVGLLITGICTGSEFIYAYAGTVFLMGVLPYGLFWLTYYKTPASAAKRMMRRVQGKELVCTFERDRLRLGLGSGGRTETLVYGALHKVVETDKYFYIYKTRINANIIPKAALDDGGSALRALLQQALPARGYRC